MSAVAINPKDMRILQGLQKSLKLRSKAQVIHRALEELHALLERDRLAQEIKRSVGNCAEADLKENEALSGGAILHAGDET
jgi:hypothetical protein